MKFRRWRSGQASARRPYLSCALPSSSLGLSLGAFEKGVKRMQAVLLDAELGLKEATDVLDLLGLSLVDLQGLSPEEQFFTFANAIGAVEDASRRAALAQDVFGRSGTSLLPFFSQGVAGMAALRQEARELGVVLSQEDANAAAELNDAINTAQDILARGQRS